MQSGGAEGGARIENMAASILGFVLLVRLSLDHVVKIRRDKIEHDYRVMNTASK